ncbi:hypothetical protein [Synechococcus sp. BS56D]|uniref:hypothetical protein n=1 Tax=Synechococcus sp. BS56D TaxID=2055944 RepID=UPI0013A5E68D|nr:hypothetical protein [Synechococcus sp. BS56D]
MILILTLSILDQLMDRERHELYDHLLKRNPSKLFYVDKISHRIIQEFIDRHWKQLSCIVYEEPIWHVKAGVTAKHFLFRIPTHCLSTSVISDFFLNTIYARYFFGRLRVDHLFTYHESSLTTVAQYSQSLRGVTLLPPSIRPQDYLAPIKKDIPLLYASHSKPFTPLRNYIYDILASSNIAVHTLPYPGTRRSRLSHSVIGSQYIELLRRSYFVITCSTQWNLSLRKYWEIGASSATPVGCSTMLPEHSLVTQNIVPISLDTPPSTLIATVASALENRDLHYAKAQLLAPKFLANYSIDSMAAHFAQVVHFYRNEKVSFPSRSCHRLSVRHAVSDFLRIASSLNAF